MQLELLKPEETTYQKKVRQAFGDWWYERLAPVLNKEMKNKVFPNALKKYQTELVYPAKENLFRVYRETPDPRVVILGQSPYHDRKNQATGRAFECGVCMSPSMDQILRHVPNDVDPFEPVLLDSWTKQGVMLLNSRLSIKHGDAQSHKDVGWNTLIRETIRALNKPNMVFLLWGSAARYFSRYVTSQDCFVFEGYHPAAVVYDENVEFNPGFKEANEYLASKGLKEINWSLLNN